MLRCLKVWQAAHEHGLGTRKSQRYSCGEGLRRFHHFQEAREEFKGGPNDIRTSPVAGQNNAASPLALHCDCGYCTAATATAAASAIEMKMHLRRESKCIGVN
ncbi:uncharacterized protein [Drosophila takahashii]|uniref:uncharacterized protein n=1 Tax=Drosophila takahashii TaxID=29030 RepID=UPI00389931DB